MEKNSGEILEYNLFNIFEKDIYIPEEFTEAILAVRYSKKREKFYLNKVAVFIFGLIITMGITGVIAYQYFLQKNDSFNYQNYYKNNDFTTIENLFEVNEEDIYYKKIINYDEYVEYKEKLNSIIEMTKEDFKENFLIILISTWKYPNLSITNINTDNNNIYIEIDSNNDKIDKEQFYIVSSMIEKDMEREDICISKKKENITSNKYIKLVELPNEYTIEEAEKDGCVIIENNKLLEISQEILEKFLNNAKNKEDDYIRIAIFSDNDINNKSDIVIYDIEFKYDNYIIYEDTTRSSLYENKDIVYLGKYKYFRISKNGIFNILGVSNFENDLKEIAIYNN